MSSSASRRGPPPPARSRRPSRSSTSSCPAAWPTRNRSIPSRSPRSNTAARWASIKTKLAGVFFNECLKQTAADRRQDHRLPLDDARRGGPRARHAQHVHRLPAQPGARVPQHGQRRQPRVRRRATTCRPTSAFPASRPTSPAPATCSSPIAPFSLGSDPANGGFTVQDLNLPGGVDDKRFDHAARHAGSGQRPLRQQGEVRRARGDGHLLPAGLQPDQLARRPARRSTSTPRPAKLRDEYGRNAAGQRMLLARRLVEAGVRFVSLTYGGWDMHGSIKRRHRRPAAGVRPGLRGADPRPGPRGLLDTHAGHGLAASSAARRRSTARPAATTGRRCSASSWPAAASRRASSTAPSDATASEPEDDPLTVEDLADDGLPLPRHRRATRS